MNEEIYKMKFTMTKIAAGLALAAMATGAHAVAITQMTIGDTIDAATNSLGTDGKAGAFKFNTILNAAGTTYSNGTSYFAGDVNGGVINLAGASANSLNPANAFTTGFTYAGSNFGPDTTGQINADITGGVLTISSLPWGGYFAGANFQFNMPPDAGTLTVRNLIQTGANDYAYRVSFSHYITSQDDPSGTYTGLTANWVLEGTMSTATAPVPEASTYGMMLSGLGLVGAAVSRRRRKI